MEHFHLEIAGYFITIYFEKPEEFPDLPKEFKKRVLGPLSPFVTTERKKADFKLVVIYKNSFDLMANLKSRKHYLGFYEESLERDCFLTYYHVSNEQFLVIIRDIIQRLILGFGVIMHGSAAEVGGGAVLFLGDSGAGKSTIVKMLSPELRILADDIFIIREIDGKYFFLSNSLYRKEYS